MGGGMTKPKMMYQEGGISDPKMSKGYNRMVADLEKFVAVNNESLDPSNKDTFDPGLYAQYKEMKKNLQEFAKLEGMIQQHATTEGSQLNPQNLLSDNIPGEFSPEDYKKSKEMEGDVEPESKGDIFNQKYNYEYI